MWPGMISFLALTTPISGLSISSSVNPGRFKKRTMRCFSLILYYITVHFFFLLRFFINSWVIYYNYINIFTAYVFVNHFIQIALCRCKHWYKCKQQKYNKNYIYRCKNSTINLFTPFYNRRFRNTALLSYTAISIRRIMINSATQAITVKQRFVATLRFFVYRINRIVGAVNLICHITLNKLRQIQCFGNINTSALRNIDIFPQSLCWCFCQSRTRKKKFTVGVFKCKKALLLQPMRLFFQTDFTNPFL